MNISSYSSFEYIYDFDINLQISSLDFLNAHFIASDVEKINCVIMIIYKNVLNILGGARKNMEACEMLNTS